MIVLKRRYLAKSSDGKVQESPDEMFWRVAKNLAQAERNYEGCTQEIVTEWTRKFHDVMASLEFLPNSPTLMNAGRDLQQLSGCFVLPVGDSIAEIFEAVKRTAIIHQSGGGTGFFFGELRPEGSMVKSTGGIASGPASFIKAFDAATDVVKQGGTRRGANMGILNVDHPDILKFIELKLNGGLENFNISVSVTEEFMQAVQNNTKYGLHDPRTGDLVEEPLARAVFQRICDTAWATGDPGIVFMDKINDTNWNPQLGPIRSTNPCWSGDTKVWTINGPKRFDELVGQEVPVLTMFDSKYMGFRMMRNIRQTSRKSKVLKITLERRSRTQDGSVTKESSITVTPTHTLFLKMGKTIKKVQAKDLYPGDSLVSVYRVPSNSQGYLDLYNGFLKDKEHRIVASWNFGGFIPYPEFHIDHIDLDKKNNLPGNLRVLKGATHISYHKVGVDHLGESNPMYGKTHSEETKDKLSTSRTGLGNPMYGKTQSEETKRLIGASSRRYQERKRTGKTLNIREEILLKLLDNHTVVSVEELEGEIPVYNGTVDETHRYYVQVAEDEGLLSANCGEQPLLPYESCNLGSLNLKLLTTNEDLDRVIPIAVRLLDNVIDANKYPLSQIEEQTKLTRRIGLGVMGWADTLIDRGIAYDSSQALALANQTSKLIQQEVHKASSDLGEERGAYPARNKPGAPPMRNTSPVTIAPTGTISMIAGCSSGIEPIFAPAYVKTVMDGTKLPEVHPKLEGFLKEYGISLLEVAEAGTLEPWEDIIPSTVRMLFRGADEINWSIHIEMQAAWQEHTDNAVSKTINMKNNVTEKDIWDAYLYAYKLGCKGVTIYRDGSKETQVLTQGTGTSQNGIETVQRPKRLDGFTEKVNTGHGNMYVTLNHLDGQLVEIFGAQGKMGGCNGAQMEAICRLISLGLRRNISPEDIVEQLEGITCCPAWDNSDLIRSNPDGIAQVMKRFLQHHTTPDHNLELGDQVLPIQVGRKCQDCNGRIIYQEGCEKCLDCGWNKCE